MTTNRNSEDVLIPQAFAENIREYLRGKDLYLPPGYSVRQAVELDGKPYVFSFQVEDNNHVMYVYPDTGEVMDHERTFLDQSLIAVRWVLLIAAMLSAAGAIFIYGKNSAMNMAVSACLLIFAVSLSALVLTFKRR